MRNWHIRTYRALLRAYPRRFRADYQEEMTRLFAEQLDYARVTEGCAGVLRVWIRSLVDFVATAPSEHFEPDVAIAGPASAGNRLTTAQARSWGGAWVPAALLPVWVLLALLLVGSGYLSVAFSNPPGMLGLPFGVVAMGLALLWSSVGLGVITATASTGMRVCALLVFTFPATVAVILIPAFVLVVANLSPA